jgi:hypothetical protein
VWYELWDTESRNLLSSFDAEDAALDAARELIALNSPAYPAVLVLTRVDSSGCTTTLAMGDALAVRIRAAEAERGRLTA